MAIKTNKSDVIANFARYHGRQPNPDELKPGALIDYLTTKAPQEVEQLLSKNSPITGGKTWSQYQAAGGQTIAKETPQQAVDNQYVAAAAQNPAISTLMQGGSSIEEIINGLSTGNLSGIVDWQGMPFSVEDQQAALAKGMEDNRLFYEAQQKKEQADVEANLAQKQADYQDYLINAGQAFEADKASSDQSAANAGILFSGARAQKEKNLERAYMQDQASKLGTVARNIGRDATDFQYKYGNDAASGLNQYYGLGGNTFNSKVARGGVGSSAISNVYNPANYNFQGTRNTERKANANTRAAGYLWNKGNKLLASGSTNQY